MLDEVLLVSLIRYAFKLFSELFPESFD